MLYYPDRIKVVTINDNVVHIVQMSNTGDTSKDLHLQIEKSLLKQYYTADQYHSIVKCSNTEIIEKFKH